VKRRRERLSEVGNLTLDAAVGFGIEATALKGAIVNGTETRTDMQREILQGIRSLDHHEDSNSTMHAKQNSAIPLVIYVTSYEKEMQGGLKRLWDANRVFFPAGARLEYYDDEQMYRSARSTSKSLEDEGIVTGAFEAFKSLRPGAFRADLWRYMKLWADGGVYLDAKLKLLRPLGSWLNFNGDGSLQLVKDWGHGHLWNAVMAVGPRDEKLAGVIQFVVGQIKARAYRHDLPKDGGCLAITGPAALAEGLRMQGVSGDDGNWNFTNFSSSLWGSVGTPVVKAQLSVTYGYGADEAVVSSVDHARLIEVHQAIHRSHGGGHYTKIWKDHQVYCDEPGPPCQTWD